MAKKPKASIEWPGATLWKLADIKPYPNNPRTHPEEQIELLAELLKKWGPDQPIVVDEAGEILKGHGRLRAAHRAGMATFPVVQRFGLSEDDKHAMRIADNQVALLSGWDQARIQSQIGSLKSSGYDIKLLAFPEAQLRGWGFGAGDAAANPEDIPLAPKKPVVRIGDVWSLGRHRLICGDSTLPATWKALFGSERAAMTFTDPPYGVSYQSDSFGIIEGDKKRRDELYKMLVGSLREMTRHTVATGAIYIWHASSTREDFAQAMKAVGLEERQYLMWVKPSIVFGHADYQWQHEPCFYAVRAGGSPAFYGERGESTVWRASLSTAKETAITVGNGVALLNGEGGMLYVQSRAPKGKKLRQVRITKGANVFLSGADRQDTDVWEVARDGQHQHPTQKPVELARRAIENSSKPGEIVADGFLGSGTTLIGAQMTGRRCFGAELDPTYAEVIIRRWQTFAGEQATLDGQSLTDVEKDRAKPGHSPRAAARRPPRARQTAEGAATIAAPSK